MIFFPNTLILIGPFYDSYQTEQSLAKLEWKFDQCIDGDIKTVRKRTLLIYPTFRLLMRWQIERCN